MRGRRDFTLPRAPRTPLRFHALALAIEAALIAAFIVFRIEYRSEPGRTFAYLLDIPAAPRAESVPPQAGRPDREQPLRLAPSREAPEALAAGPGAGATPADSDRIALSDTVLALPGGGAAPRRSLATLGPRYADSPIWVRPTVTGWPTSNRPINMDSVVRQRLLAMADSIERNPTPDPSRPANLTFRRNGRLYGLDSAGLHLGGITIPAPLLALIPFPQGNIDQARANARLAAMRADIMRAAARAEAEEDFRRAVQLIRERNDRERRERRERERDRGGERPIP